MIIIIIVMIVVTIIIIIIIIIIVIIIMIIMIWPRDVYFLFLCSAVDVTGWREKLVRAVSPMQTVEEARAGEFTPTRWAAHHQDQHNHAQDLLQRSEKSVHLHQY